MTWGLLRAGGLALAMLSISGCAFIERIFTPRDVAVTAQSGAGERGTEQITGPITLSGAQGPSVAMLVEPQVTVMAPMSVSTAPGAGVYARHCRDCHGAKARGNGRFASDLPVRPADLTALALNNGGSFPAERVIETIHGYPGKFHRGSMPEFGETLDGPLVEWVAPSGQVILTPQGLLDVLVYIESLQV